MVEESVENAYPLRGRAPRRSVVVAAACTIWILVVSAFGVWMAAAPFGPPFADPAPRNFAPPDMAAASVVVIALCVIAGLITRAMRPASAFIAVSVTATAIFVAAAVTTRSIGSLVIAVLLCAAAWITGTALVGLAGARTPSWCVRHGLAFALGLAIVSTLWILLALAGWLNAPAVTVTTLTVVVVTTALRARFTDSRGLPRGQLPSLPPPASWFDVLIFSLLMGLVTFASLSALVPENQSDATRQHLPIAREFWQASGVPVIDSMPVTMQSVQNHVIFAVAYGLGGMTSAKLMQAALSIACIIGVAGLADLAGGRLARLYGAAILGAMPILLWEMGHAFIDVLPVLLTVAAATCLLLWLEDSRLRWVFTAGVLLSVGLAGKLNMVVYIAAFALGVMLVGPVSGVLKDRLVALVALATGGIVAIPWLVRTADAYGILNGRTSIWNILGIAGPSLPAAGGPIISASPVPGSVAPDITPVVATFPNVAQQFGHAPGDLLGLPGFLTFQGKDFGFPIIGRGEIGVALLMLLPLVYYAPRTRTTAVLSVLSIASLIGWWLSPYQVVRHLLPTLALAAAVVAAGMGGLLTRAPGTRADHVLRAAARGGLLLSLILVPLFFVPSSRAQMPIPYLMGQETREHYIQRAIRSAVVLEAASALLPADTPVVYVGGPWEVPQLYSEARLVTIPREDLGPDAEAVLANFARIGAHHLIWNRADSPEEDWRTPALSTSFLRRYTRILAGADDAYLFELLPAGNTTWGLDSVSNLLQDPELEKIKQKRGTWTIEGKSVVADRVVSLSRRATLTQEVAVTPNHAYLLEAPFRCLEPSGRGILTLRWLDASGQVIGSATEEVRPGQEITDQFIWRRAPENAARVQAEFSMTGPTRCEVSGAALYDLG